MTRTTEYGEFSTNYVLVKDKQQQQRTDGLLALPLEQGFLLVHYQEILYCRSVGHQTQILLSENQEGLWIKKQLKAVEATLPSTVFLRVHQSYLVNLKHVKKWVKGSKNQLLLTGGHVLPLSRSRYKELEKRLQFIP